MSVISRLGSSSVVHSADVARWLPPPGVLLWPALITLGLWATSLNPLSAGPVVVSFLLSLIAWWSYWYWQNSKAPGLPVFSAIVIMYWLYFGVQVFWGSLNILTWRGLGPRLSEAAITEAMLLVLFGVVFLWLGMKSGIGGSQAPKQFPEISWKPMNLLYIQGLALAGTLMIRSESLLNAGGEGFRQAALIFQNTVSTVAIVILLRRVLAKRASQSEKIFLYGVIALRLVFGFATGLLGSVAVLAMVCGLVYLQKRRKLPIVAMSLVLPYVLFFQPGKAAFRQTYWYNQVEGGTFDRVAFWVNASLKQWQMALEDPNGNGVSQLLAFSLSRTSLLNQAGNVIQQTPDIVPYQYGRLYLYLPVSFIPRVLWPDKPSMNEANQFYQVAYGVTRAQDLDRISIAVGALTEGYMNFGWIGTAMVMFAIGVLLEFWNVAFLSENVTLLAGAIGVTIFPILLSVEFQLAQYASGLIQHVVLTVIVYLPVTRRRTANVPKASRREIEMAHGRF